MMCPTCFNKGWRFTLPPGADAYNWTWKRVP